MLPKRAAFKESNSPPPQCQVEAYHTVYCICHGIICRSFLLPVWQCLLNRWQRASSARCPEKKTRDLDTSRTSKLPSPDSFDVITAEIVVSQRWALPQHSCKTLRPSWFRERLGMSFVQLGCLEFVAVIYTLHIYNEETRKKILD